MNFLGIDAGGTATRWALVDGAGAEIARGETRGLSGHVFNPAIRAGAEAAIAAIAEAVLPYRPVAAIHAGVTGLPFDAPEADWIRDNLAAACGCAPEAVAAEDDISLAYRACLKPGQGVLVYAGTGSLALHMTTNGERWRAGGHGFLIDDGGSAVWIARAALRRLLTCEDSAPDSGWSTPLGRHFAERFGKADWPSARAYVYGVDRGRLGELARAVAAAASEGDPLAATVLTDAGIKLAELAQTLLVRTGPLPVALAGGALKLSPTIGAAFVTQIGEATPVRVVEIDAALTAARLAASNPAPRGP